MPLGPPPGRYVVRRYAGDEASHVIVVGGDAAGAPGADAGRRLRRRGGRSAGGTVRAVGARAGAGAPAGGRVAIVGAQPLDAPEAWLSAAGADTVASARAVLDAALHAHRVAGADAALADLGPRQVVRVLVGYGTGDEVAAGRWTAARELPAAPAEQRREAALRPQERFAALLGARDAVLACELLALRARADVDHGRPREAALQLEAALEAALAELDGWRELGDLAGRLAELAELAPRVAALAAAARSGTLGPADAEATAHALARLESTLRARTAAAQF